MSGVSGRERWESRSRPPCAEIPRPPKYIHRPSRYTALPYATDRIQSTLDLLILKTLSWGPAHGYAIARWIEQLTGDALTVGEGTLYPALHRLESRGAVSSEWQIADSGRRARFYALTRDGRAQLTSEQRSWKEFVRAMSNVLDATEQPS